MFFFYHILNKPKIYNIYICYNQIHEFMYKPVINSIINILKNYYTYNEINIILTVNLNENNLLKDDILILVGCNLILPDFNNLKEKSIYTIYYNTEPDINELCTNEIWTYSKYAFTLYKKNHIHQIIRFIPIILETNVPFVPYHINSNLKLSFIGQFCARADYKKHILINSDLLKNNLEEINYLWNDIDYNNYISERPRIYLNLIKSMLPSLPTVRINKLLSHKCIIISEHTNYLDEEIYDGIIYFCYIEEIVNVYKNLIKKSNNELLEEAENKYNLFYNKFHITNIKNQILKK